MLVVDDTYLAGHEVHSLVAVHLLSSADVSARQPLTCAESTVKVVL